MRDSLTTLFDGHPLTTYDHLGRPAWIARDIGVALGYARDGKRLVTLITSEWDDEFIEGHDYVLLAGEDLAQLRADDDSLDAVRRSLLVLLEPGVHLVLTKTSKPAGRRLRRFLVDHVLPRLVRTGTFDGDLDEEDAEPTSWRVASPRISTGRLREERLARRVDLDDRKLKVRTLLHAADTLRDRKSVV